MDLKDLFQFGVPTVLLGFIIWHGPTYIERIALSFRDVIKEGFAHMETAIKDSRGEIKEANERWREMLMSLHRENREDISKDRDARHADRQIMQDAMLRLQEKDEKRQA